MYFLIKITIISKILNRRSGSFSTNPVKPKLPLHSNSENEGKVINRFELNDHYRLILAQVLIGQVPDLHIR